MTWFVVIFGLGLLIFLHELGHFCVARLVGMKPRAFYVGFPPALAKIQRNGIEYGIGAIPLGGYVRLPGMRRPSADDFAARRLLRWTRITSSGSRRTACSTTSRPETSTRPARSCRL